MPFTIGGDYIPEKNQPERKKRGVKVRSTRRKNSYVTEIYNLDKKSDEIKRIAGELKKRLGCGGSVKNDRIEIQGSKVDEVKNLLLQMGIKSS